MDAYVPSTSAREYVVDKRASAARSVPEREDADDDHG